MAQSVLTGKVAASFGGDDLCMELYLLSGIE
jgi:hypothetical protein